VPPIDVSARSIALVVGDTAGHTHPALAVADALRLRDPKVGVVFIGTGDSVAASIIRRAGERFCAVPGSPIRRASLAGLVRAASRSLSSIARSRRLLRAEGVGAAIGFGGFASGGVLLAARSIGVPTVILEANVELGLANRWLRPWATVALQGLGAPDASVVGVPVRHAARLHTAGGRRRSAGPLRVLVASGSRGADFFDTHMPRVVRLLATDPVSVGLEVWQQGHDVDGLRRAYGEAGVQARTEPFIADIADAYGWADVAIARAGASTIAELALAGLPAFLVPLRDASADHQTANARLWAQAGAGAYVAETAWRDTHVADWLRRMATDAAVWDAAAQAARRLARPSAAEDVAAACLRLLYDRRRPLA
jgi:UDP-N-acetylglucosamine--N-acetylmuramyl-(pentapeptide) pyrophosphoryl-undecaprenol N-acetylglucosamine transferase